jgi:hypothetical protein
VPRSISRRESAKRKTVHHQSTKFRKTRNVSYQKHSCSPTVLSNDTLNGVSLSVLQCRLNHSTEWHVLTRQCTQSDTTACVYMVRGHHVARLHCCRWRSNIRLLDPTALFSYAAWFHLRGYGTATTADCGVLSMRMRIIKFHFTRCNTACGTQNFSAVLLEDAVNS